MRAKNIINGLKLEGKPAKIPDCGRDDLPEFFKLMGYEVGAEIGVYKGEYHKRLLDAGLKTYGIDPWLAYGNYDEFHEERLKQHGSSKFQSRQDFLFDHTKRYLAEYIDSGQCTLVRKTSMDAIHDFEDNSLDFVYIDGHHGFRYIAEDLVEWSQKVRPGGVISGHDYALNKKPPRDPYVLQVKYVLHAFTEAFGVDNWYVLGEDSPEGERIVLPANSEKYHHIYRQGDKDVVRDRWRSWFWIKK